MSIEMYVLTLDFPERELELLPLETQIRNLNFPGEESIQEVIERYNGETVFLRESSGLFKGLRFEEYPKKDGVYRIGAIRRPGTMGFTFETPPNRIVDRASVRLNYSDVLGLIVDETNRTGREKFVKFVC